MAVNLVKRRRKAQTAAHRHSRLNAISARAMLLRVQLGNQAEPHMNNVHIRKVTVSAWETKSIITQSNYTKSNYKLVLKHQKALWKMTS